MNRKLSTILAMAVATLICGSAFAQHPGEAGALGERVEQIDVISMTVSEAADEGLRIFTTPFNKIDGYGDGPINPADTTTPGGRPTLQGNGTLLRVNGLDAQACFECHTLVSNATVPAMLGIGGAGGTNSNAMFQPAAMDPGDSNLDGIADFTGRFINPPFLFGVGGVELVGLEMTAELQALKQQAIDNPFTTVVLNTKGVNFGAIQADGLGNVDTSGVIGVDHDLVVRPFGRKGEFATTRDFDVGAMEFHFGMQSTESVGVDNDADGDGVVNEITVGELSSLSVFLSTLARPVGARVEGNALVGEALFSNIGCAGCHIPTLETDNLLLPLRFPQVAEAPWENVYKNVDLTKKPAGFEPNGNGGVRVPMFSDLKRHDMGPGLAEDFALATDQQNREFITAKLWGVVDSGPWLHDGRALTITDAILLHGGEAQLARDEFEALTASQRRAILAFLRTLQTPKPNQSSGTGRPHPRLQTAGSETDGVSRTISRRE